MAESEVTVGQCRKCMEAEVCTEQGTRDKCTWVKASHEDHPINYVDWGQTRNLSHWAGDDLPTKAKLEYAARAGESLKYTESREATQSLEHH